MQKTLLAAMACTLAGCADQGRDNDARIQLDALTSRVAALEQRQPVEKTGVVLTVGDNDEFSAVKTDLGFLTFSLKDVQPFASGSRVKVTIGNPLSATINSLDTTVYYGTDLTSSTETGKTLARTISTALPPGTFTTVTIDLPGVRPDKLGYITFNPVTIGNIRMAVGA